jgi:hypothetical protein
VTRAAETLVMATVLAVAACGGLEPRGWLLDRTRVLAARVEAASEPRRASLSPGEQARISWLVAGPGAPPRLAWAYALCAAPTGNTAEPRCATRVLAAATGQGDGGVVVMDLAVPPPSSIEDARELLLLAAFCETGAPALDALSFTATCAGASAPLLASTKLRLASEGPNQNPTSLDDAVRAADAVLPPSAGESAGGPCEPTADAPRVAAGVSVDLAYDLRDADREDVPPPGRREQLLLTHVVTAGELDRQYSALDPEEPARTVTVPWTAPARDTVGPGGLLVRVIFVLRDGRGGTSFARRAVCVRAD